MHNYITYPFFSNGGEPDWIWRAPRTPNEKYQQFLRELDALKHQQIYQNKPPTAQHSLRQMGFKSPDIRGGGPKASSLDLINARLNHQRMMDPAKLVDIRFDKLFGNPNNRLKLGYDTQGLRAFLKGNPGLRMGDTKSIMDDVREVTTRTRPIDPRVAQAMKYMDEMDAAIKAGKTIDEIPDAPWHKSNQIKPSRWSRIMNSPFIKTVGKVARVIDPFPFMIAPTHPYMFQDPNMMPQSMAKGGEGPSVMSKYI
tara:strand:+ start:438 stop:1199 length:762 start_codon:yes stop_codon:yes gene_type:complete